MELLPQSIVDHFLYTRKEPGAIDMTPKSSHAPQPQATTNLFSVSIDFSILAFIQMGYGM